MRRKPRIITGIPCPRCGSTDTRSACNYGRPQAGRMWCLACFMLWDAPSK